MMLNGKTSITITLNGKSLECTQGASVKELLVQQGLGDIQGIAVAVNNRVVRRQNWEITELVSGDSVVILTAVQGG